MIVLCQEIEKTMPLRHDETLTEHVPLKEGQTLANKTDVEDNPEKNQVRLKL
jgi:hypothetical protein